MTPIVISLQLRSDGLLKVSKLGKQSREGFGIGRDWSIPIFSRKVGILLGNICRLARYF